MRNLSHENEFCMQFHFHANQSHFHNNGFALRLALKRAQGNSEMSYTGSTIIALEELVETSVLV